MRLLDLEPMFCRRVIKVEPRMKLRAGRDPLAGPFADSDFDLVTGPVEYREPVDSLADAHGISFLCPKCIAAGGHSIICWFEDRVPAEATPGPGRWKPTGSSFSDLSFVPGKRSNSVQINGGCHAHFFVERGEITRMT